MVEGYASRPSENLDVHHASVSPGYFDLLRMPLLAGRDFRPEDNETAPRVMIVNESFARRFFDGRDPVGRRVQIYGKPFTIVGMVKDSKYYSLSETPQPYFYMSFDQVHYGSGENGVAFYVRTDRDARDLVPILRREMSAIDPNSAGLTAMALVGLHLGCLVRVADRLVVPRSARHHCHAARRGRSLWSYGLLGKPTDSGNRYPHGAGGRPWRRASDCHERRLVAGFIGDRRRPRHRPGSDPADRASAVPGQSSRPCEHSGGSAVPYCGCGTREPDPSAASHQG